MATLKDLYSKISSRYYNIEEAIEFIELAAKAINPTIECRPEFLMAVIQSGFLTDSILPLVIQAVEKNPNKVGFQVTKVYSNPYNLGDGRSLIKIIINDL